MRALPSTRAALAGLAAARAHGRIGGRPGIMTPDKLAIARQMLAEGTVKSVIAKAIGVARPTLYAHLRALDNMP
jgi:DNA invertase Pin-like site-specific DNA recombinase